MRREPCPALDAEQTRETVVTVSSNGFVGISCQVSRSRAASAVMRFLERHRGAVVAAAEREACRKAGSDGAEVGRLYPPSFVLCPFRRLLPSFPAVSTVFSLSSFVGSKCRLVGTSASGL